MRFRTDMRKLVLPLIVVFAIVAVIVPSCQMVGCTAPMRFMPLLTGVLGLGATSNCGGTFVFDKAPSAVVPSGADSLLLTLVAAVAIAVAALFAPPALARSLALVRIEPPWPPEDLRGQRLLI